jgi:hypothetical protein
MSWTAEGSEFESRYGQDFSPLHLFQTGSGAHPAPYRMGTEDKAAGREADHPPPTSAEVKNTWIYTYTPLYASVG